MSKPIEEGHALHRFMIPEDEVPEVVDPELAYLRHFREVTLSRSACPERHRAMVNSLWQDEGKQVPDKFTDL